MKYVHFYGNAGYGGTDYNIYMKFEDDTSCDIIDEYSEEYALNCAESFAYLEHGWGKSWEDEEQEEVYYDNVFENCGWEYVSREEWEEHEGE